MLMRGRPVDFTEIISPMRLHLFEFEDQSWFPNVIRTGGTDYLRYLLVVTEVYKPCIRLLNEVLSKTGETKLVDLCSGGGGYIEQLYQEVGKISTHDVSFTLTDKFPNIKAYQHLQNITNGKIAFDTRSIDAANVPGDLKGIRTMFSAIHHFRPGQVESILQNAAANNAPIAIFDGGDKSIFGIIGILIIHPLAFLLFTPFFKPFKFSRLFFTYIIPLIPLYTIWDGCVSIMRLYKPNELLKIAKGTSPRTYKWVAGKTKSRFGLHASYLIGTPAN
jgi:hypothetical protein